MKISEPDFFIPAVLLPSSGYFLPKAFSFGIFPNIWLSCTKYCEQNIWGSVELRCSCLGMISDQIIQFDL